METLGTTVTIVIGITSFILAFLSLIYSVKANRISSISISTLAIARKEIESEFQRVFFCNLDTQNQISHITKLIGSTERHGLEMVYPNLISSLFDFEEIMSRESNSEVQINGRSLRDLYYYIGDFEEIIKKNPKNFKFILTHPEVSQDPEGVEDPNSRLITNQVARSESLKYIPETIRCGVPPQHIQFYKGITGVLVIKTKNHMLISPYTIGTELHKTFCIQVKCDSTIYKQYKVNHFDKIFDSDRIETYVEYLKRIKNMTLRSMFSDLSNKNIYL